MPITAGPSHFDATSASFFMQDFKLSRTEATAALLGLPASFFKPFATGNVHSTDLVISVRVGNPACVLRDEERIREEEDMKS